MRLSQYRISQRIQINPVHCQRSLLLSNTFYQPSIRVMLHEFLSCKIICTEYFLRNLKSRLLRLHYNFCIRTVMAVGLRIYVTQVQKCEKKIVLTPHQVSCLGIYYRRVVVLVTLTTYLDYQISSFLTNCSNYLDSLLTLRASLLRPK